MNEKEIKDLNALEVHILYIRENMEDVRQEVKDISNKLNGLPCNSHSQRLGEVEDCINNIKKEKKEQSNWSKKKMVAVIGGLASIISAVISAVISKIM